MATPEHDGSDGSDEAALARETAPECTDSAPADADEAERRELFRKLAQIRRSITDGVLSSW